MTIRVSQIRPGVPPARGFLVRLLFAGLSLAVAPAADVSYTKQIRPLLEAKCYQCHGEQMKMADLDVRTVEAMLKGGKNGPSVVPGEPANSHFYLRVTGAEAPVMPMGGEISQDEIELIRDWIAQGAKNDGAVAAAASDGPDDPASWWAFQPVKKPAVPEVADARWNQSPIDAFLMSRYRQKGLTPAPKADRRTLIRRAYLDLIGLLPTPEETDAFVNDTSSEAWENLIDRLLASKHYGERWGRHWLDVVRYADSGGYEHDFDFPDAWRYRDYVIKALNDDKPYDQFIQEQLAGDELDKTTFETLTATGFYRVGPRVLFREKDNPDYRYNYLDDIIGTTGRAFMGLSVNCARCHDHKFDPISQVDYYRMMAVFFPYVRYDHPLASPEVVAAHEAKTAGVEERVKPLKKQIAEIEKPYKELAREKALLEFPDYIQQAVRTPEEKRTEGQKLLAAQVIRGGGKVDEFLSESDRAQIKELEARIDEIQKELPEPLPTAMGIRDGDYRFAPDGAGDEPQPGKGDREFYDFEGSFLPEAGKPYVPPPAHILPTGDYHTKGPEVHPGFLEVIARGNPPTSHLPNNGHITSGRRRALADWLTSKDHPLTARVMANRIWAFHFGKGIVSTPSNFGKMGRLPTHPELLDWLASEFVSRGWSIKAMHKLMMTSEAYQMAAAFQNDHNAKADPANDQLWKFPQRRLEAEAIRDVILAASGNLNVEMGGKPFFPPIPASLRHGFNKGEWVMTKEGPDTWRRSVYSYWKRGLRYPMFEVFDQPDPNVTCERRNTTTVPTQALTLLNNEFILMQADFFAKRVASMAGPEQDARVRAAYRVALGREPRPSELEHNVKFLNEQQGYHRGRDLPNPEHAALVDLCDVVLNLNEFVYIN